MLRYYHITTGLPPDIMHDVLEGVAVVELRWMLKALIQDLRKFTLTTLNNRIKQFPYGVLDASSKPLPLPEHTLSSATETLKQSGKTHMSDY